MYSVRHKGAPSSAGLVSLIAAENHHIYCCFSARAAIRASLVQVILPDLDRRFTKIDLRFGPTSKTIDPHSNRHLEQRPG